MLWRECFVQWVFVTLLSYEFWFGKEFFFSTVLFIRNILFFTPKYGINTSKFFWCLKDFFEDWLDCNRSAEAVKKIKGPKQIQALKFSRAAHCGNRLLWQFLKFFIIVIEGRSREIPFHFFFNFTVLWLEYLQISLFWKSVHRR